MLEHDSKKSITHRFFYISVLLKALNGMTEIVLGISVFFITKETLSLFVAFIARVELSEDPGDLLANYLVKAVEHYTFTNQLYISVYLLIHGILKVGVVYCLLRKYLWAYPTAITIFGLFGVYQIFAYIHTPNPSLIVLTFLDVFIMTLTYVEYRNLKTAPGGN
jgi:uncharacterized membrane protein